jgi:hypothetical protein
MDTLKALQNMLHTIGHGPPASLTSPMFPEALRALAVLEATREEVCGHGWWFNMDRELTIAKAPDGTYPLPGSTLSVRMKSVTDPKTGAAYRPVMRDGKLWDPTTHSDKLTFTPVAERIVYDVAFDRCPPSFQFYVLVKAARRFASGVLVANAPEIFTAQDEVRALAGLRSEHASSWGRNMFLDDTSGIEGDRYAN